MKKFIRTLLALALTVISVIGLVACGEDQTETGETGVIYKRYNGQDFWTVQDYVNDGVSTTLTIPSEKDGLPVVKIAEGAFDGSELEEIIVPTSVKEIGAGAFKNMPKLKNLTLPFVGRYFNAEAQEGTAGSQLTEPVDNDYSNVWAQGIQRTFFHVFSSEYFDTGEKVYSGGTTYYIPISLEKVTIAPGSAYELPREAFKSEKQTSGGSPLSLLEVILTDNVVGIGENAFKLAKIETLVIPNTVVNIYKNAFESCNITTFSFEQPDDLNQNKLEVISEKAFYDATITNTLEIPSGVKILGESCFASSNIKSITLSSELTTISRYAFANCESLKAVIANNSSVINPEICAFYNCALLESIDHSKIAYNAEAFEGAEIIVNNQNQNG